MPFDRDVTIDFNADISGYSASMAQMIQQTSQYSAAADGMIGKIGKLNNVVMAGVKSMSAFTQTNKVATAQAAAYQQQLSKIETSAKVNNKSFKELEKTTKGLAKDFPIGMKQAVEQVEALQEAGVTSNKEIASLAKTFTKLGAATGTFGPEVGQNMLQLNRTFENSTTNMEKYADSLTTVTHQFGANAGAVTSFAKSIAPVAATVGMSETSVIGLSTAFSRLGEDGYAAANTFNKVMLDMSKSIREGTPEAQIYAEVMGTTAENLKKTWESNPAEGFIDFVEAIKAQGTGGIRSLEMLGLEGVRTQKTIMSLANSGDMRKIVESAQQSFGGGATGTAAETAMGGVNDQLTMMNETMAQTAATAGKPFLGFLEQVLKVANSLSKVLSDLVESDAIQGLAKVVGVAGGAWGLTKLMNTIAPMMAFGQTAGQRVARTGMVRGFRMGMQFPGELEREGYRETVPRSVRAGAAFQEFLGAPGGPGAGGGVGRGLRGITNMGGNLAALWWRSNADMMERAMGKEGLSTPEGQRFKQALTGFNEVSTQGLGWRERRKAFKDATARATDALKDVTMLEGGVGRAGQAWLKQSTTSARYLGYAGRGAGRALGAVGGSLAGMVGITGLSAGAATGVAVAGAAVGAGAYYIQQKRKEEEAVKRGGQDAYRMFNEFAEKAGIATRGLVTFADALNESTAAIAGESDNRAEAMEITEKEIIQSQTPGYQRAYTTRGQGWVDELLPGKPSQEKEALRIRGMLGPNPSLEAINRLQIDVLNQFGQEFAEGTFDQYEKFAKMSSEEVQTYLGNAATKSKFLGFIPTEESREYSEMQEAERARKVNLERSVIGAERQSAQQYAGAEIGYEALIKAQEGATAKTALGDTAVQWDRAHREQISEAQQQVIDSLELSAAERKSLLKAMNDQTNMGKDLPSMMEAAGLGERAEYYRKRTAEGGAAEGGFRNLTPAELERMEMSPIEQAAQDSAKTFKGLGLETGTLAKDMAGAAKAYRKWTETAENADKTFEDWVETGAEGATTLQKAYAAVKVAPGSETAKAALTSEIVKNALAQSRVAGTGAVGAQQIIASAMTTSTGEEMPAVQEAYRLAEMQGQIEQPVARLARARQVIARGKQGEALMMDETVSAEQRAVGKQWMEEGLQQQLTTQQEWQQFYLNRRRQQEDFNLQMSHMNRDFERSQAYAAQDYGRQRKYMIQDYHRNVLRAEQDFYTQRRRAQRDFDKQITRQAEETAKNMFDPYQRIAPQMVTDLGVLQQSLLEQNQSIADQLEGVSRLSDMGLSKDAIDQLKLMDPGQNQQVQRMLADAITNPQGINEINNLVNERLRLGTEISTSEFNKAFQNMKEDFGTSMEDMSDDFEKNMKRGEQDFKRGLRRNGEAFATAQSRAAQAHQTALSDMAEANEKAQRRAFEDLTGIADEYQMSYADIEKKFLQDLANLPGSMSPATQKAIEAVLNAELKAIENANTKATTAGKGSAGTQYYVPGQGWVSPPGGGEGGEDMEGVDGPTAGIGSYSGNWQRYRSGKWHGGADIAAPTGTPTYSVIPGHVKYTRRMTTSYGIHAVLTDGKHDFLYGHMSALNVNAGDRVKPGTQVGRVGSTGNSTGPHLHFEVRRFGMGNGEAGNLNPAPWLAEGGVVTKHIQPHVGEDGPEAVIPLNEKGARYLADAMDKSSLGRYWQNHDAKKTFAQQHSSPVTNNVYTYDQRTQFSGEVHVESQDPEAMARKLAARERRNRLARKQGSAA